MPYSFYKNLCRKYALFFHSRGFISFHSVHTFVPCAVAACFVLFPWNFFLLSVCARLLTLQVFREVFLPISKCPVFDAVVTKMHQYITGLLLLSYTAMLMKIMHVNLCRHNPAELSTTCAYCTDDRRVVRADFTLGMFKTWQYMCF